MNPYLQKLLHAAQAPERRIIGLMAGTSLDGLDIALCRIGGSGRNTRVALERFATVPFSEAVKARIRVVFARKEVNFQHLTLLNAWLGRLHGQLVADQLAAWGVAPDTVDAIASHGQTVFHAPRILHGLEDYPNATLQIADGDHVAWTTGISTLSDFRQKHVAAGGEGAPLAVYGDYYLFAHPSENRILLNLGGIANFTYLPAGASAEGVFVTDTGPGNTLLDALARQALGRPYDADGALAAAGQPHLGLLAALKADPFFEAPMPRTTGPELFNLDYVARARQRAGVENLVDADLMATLVRFSAETATEAILQATEADAPYTVYLSGGGMHNPVLAQTLRALLPHFSFSTTDALGIPGDAKEAVLFAVLANETLAGDGADFGRRPGVPAITMGKISLPR
jgi:anhydro-N-acetylmuramic acid kinase